MKCYFPKGRKLICPKISKVKLMRIDVLLSILKTIINTMVYIVELPDESTEKYAANIITENVLYQVY